MKACRALLLFCASLPYPLFADAPPKAPPDVFLITIDTLRADHVHCYGFANAETPAHVTIAEVLRQRSYHSAAFSGAVILDSNTLAPGFDRGFDFYDNFPEHATSKSRWGRVERRAMDVVQHAEAWLSAHPVGPHFMWVHLYDPHDPYEPPAPYSEKYKDHLYDGEVAYADSALGSFIGFLKRRGLFENAIV